MQSDVCCPLSGCMHSSSSFTGHTDDRSPSASTGWSDVFSIYLAK